MKAFTVSDGVREELFFIVSGLSGVVWLTGGVASAAQALNPTARTQTNPKRVITILGDEHKSLICLPRPLFKTHIMISLSANQESFNITHIKQTKSDSQMFPRAVFKRKSGWIRVHQPGGQKRVERAIHCTRLSK